MIPYGKQKITEEDIDAVIRVLRSSFLTQGPAVSKFEQSLRSYTDAKHAVAVNSCTSALHLSCLALGLGPGDILWTSPISFVASANCALYCGASVDFVDIEPDTALMSVEKLEEKLQQAEKEGKLPKIVVPVHFAGQPCDMQQVHELGKKYGFSIIEDAAHAIGARYQGEPVGNCRYSDITVFSFHPVKIITTGEGGAALTNDLHLAERIALLRSHGVTRDPEKMSKEPDGPWYYEQIELGFNYRMTDIQAALGYTQMESLDHFVSRRNEIASWYDEKFNVLSVEPLRLKSERDSAYHLYVTRIEGGEKKRDYMHNQLREAGVGVNLHFIPVYQQPYYRTVEQTEDMQKECVSTDNLKWLNNAEHFYARAISLPIYPALQLEEMHHVVQVISQVTRDFEQ